jgi:CheY-like chemotaxis protein
MENLIFYTDRYKVVKDLKIDDLKSVRLYDPKTADIDLFINKEIVETVLNDEVYNNIFLPISPFSGFTVFIGLKIAIHIKLCSNKNKFANVFLYSSENNKLILENKLSNVLKFKEVNCIDFSKNRILENLNTPLSLDENILIKQINNLNLDVPSDYFDNHSVANEWGIYQLARNANIDIKEISDFNFDKLNRLYLKWLIKKNNLDIGLKKEIIVEQKAFRNRLRGTTVVGNIDSNKRLMKILLIDDNANRGWKQILEKILTVPDLEIVPSLSFDDAINKVLEKYDFIFLDIRMTEEDHKGRNIFKTSGYKILKEIKKDFTSINFPTPIILLTASNKIWNIDAFRDYGVDAYYIKEHPNFVFDEEASKQNLNNLQKNFERLIEVGENRKVIWGKINEICKLSNENFNNENIKTRIDEKLRIGYALLFRSVNSLEKNILLFNNEVNSFIIFWSILEEISHEFFGRLNENEKVWTIKSNSKNIQWFEGAVLKSKFSTIKKEFNSTNDIFDIDRGNQVNLSNQIAALLRYRLEWGHHIIRSEFSDKLNKYRNEIDFIHSSTNNILNKEISKTYNADVAFSKCSYMLDFIIKLIK